MRLVLNSTVDNRKYKKNAFVEASAEVKAFPEAEGFGKDATGGRGGTVIKVTTLNSTGAGSLRTALTTSGTRIIVFEVGGIIDLGGSDITINEGNLTIAGQHSLGGGILVRDGQLTFVNLSNVIVRYMRFRGSFTAGKDIISIRSTSVNTTENIIFDHCSISWATDGNFDINGDTGSVCRNITIQNSLLAECSKNALLFASVENVTYFQNLMALNNSRVIRSNTNNSSFAFEMINNLVYGFTAGTQITSDVKFTILNNHYKDSSGVERTDSGIIGSTTTVTSATYAYIDGNILPINPTTTSWVSGVIDSDYTPELETTPFRTSGTVEIATVASAVEGNILSTVGASKPSRDAVDTRLVANWNAGDGVLATTGTFPTIAGGTPLTDTSGDGMPDAWKTDNGLNPATDDSTFVWTSGYIGVEEYINQL